jgi:hypothetical protein
MTLTEAQIERFARQIVLPEVGGRGQARLLGATAAVAGSGAAALFAGELLERAGLGTRAAEAADVVLDFSADRAAILARGRMARDARRPFIVVLGGDDTAEATTLVGGPCVDCATLGTAAGEPGAPFALALGALAAGEALRVLLAPPAAGRVQALDLRTGDLAARTLDGPRCAACEAAAS